ncbi:MAG: hypothetical protein Q9213_002502 [Squamulea squamosa]
MAADHAILAFARRINVLSLGDNSSTFATPPSQPGLGNFSFLPPEIRSHIWQYHFQAYPSPVPMCDQSHCNTQPSPQQKSAPESSGGLLSGALTLLQSMIPNTSVDEIKYKKQKFSISLASKQLHHETLAEFYRSRTLSICFNNNDHKSPEPQNQMKLYTKIDGFCVLRDFTNPNFYTDPSRFGSISLNIQLPADTKAVIWEVFRVLELQIRTFCQLVHKWQKSRDQQPSSFPKVDITLRLYPDTMIYRDHVGNPIMELNLLQIDLLLRNIAIIDNCQHVTFNVDLQLRYGQEYLAKRLAIIARKMKTVGTLPQSEEESAEEVETHTAALHCYYLTELTLGSTRGGALPPGLPDYRVMKKFQSYHVSYRKELLELYAKCGVIL